MSAISPDSLLKRLSEEDEAYHRYLEKKNLSTLFCFVEGINDSDYYLGIIRHIFGEDYLILPCGNKQKVLSLYEKIYELDSKRYKIAFFVDHDFDSEIVRDGIFVTDRYSIENYYCTVDVFKRILISEIKIPEKASYLPNVLEIFSSAFGEFHDKISYLNAFISVIRKIERKKGKEYKLNLGDQIPVDLIEIKNLNCKKKYNHQYLLEKYGIPEEDNVTEKDVLDEMKRLAELNPFYSFRGKYELNFFVKLLVFLKENANKEKGDNRIIKKRISSSFEQKRFMANYAIYADIPPDLSKYIKAFI